MVIGPGGPIRWGPDYTQEVDYEAELVIVIGRPDYRIDRAEEDDYIAGNTSGNDVSAETSSMETANVSGGKSLDTFAPIEPDLVTMEAIDDPQDLRI